MKPERLSNNRHNTHTTIKIFLYITQCNHNILETPFFKEYIETINVNTNKLTINNSKNFDIDIIIFQNTTKEYPYYSRVYTVYNKETQYFEFHEYFHFLYSKGWKDPMEKSCMDHYITLSRSINITTSHLQILKIYQKKRKTSQTFT